MKHKPINKTFRITNKITLYKLEHADRYTFYFCKTGLLYHKSDESTPAFVYKNLCIAYFFASNSCAIYIYVIDPNSVKFS